MAAGAPASETTLGGDEMSDVEKQLCNGGRQPLPPPLPDLYDNTGRGVAIAALYALTVVCEALPGA